jgi:hypothetical protein
LTQKEMVPEVVKPNAPLGDPMKLHAQLERLEKSQAGTGGRPSLSTLVIGAATKRPIKKPMPSAMAAAVKGRSSIAARRESPASLALSRIASVASAAVSLAWPQRALHLLGLALELRFFVAGRPSKTFFCLAANIFGAAAEAIVSHEQILLRDLHSQRRRSA